MAPAEITEDYYAILEVSNTATVEVVIKSYRRLAKVLHPDKNPHKQDATASFQRVSTSTLPSVVIAQGAYRILLPAGTGVCNGVGP